MACVRAFITPFGPLFIPKSAGDHAHFYVDAEVRALELLSSVVEGSDVWRTVNVEERVVVISNDVGPQIRMDPITTVSCFLLFEDEHLKVRMDGKRVCVTKQSGPKCAVADGLVALALLGDAGWPAAHTPEPMRPKSSAAEQLRLLMWEEGSPENFAIPATRPNIERFEQLAETVRKWPIRKRLVLLGEYARQLYVCNGVDMESIQRNLTLLMDSVAPRDVQVYLSDPEEPSDALFFQPLLDEATKQGISAVYVDLQEVTEWTRIWT
jgi:hypothetical protein